MRCRSHRIAFGADIKMMYRPIQMEPRDSDLQRKVWSPSLEKELKHYYQLLTVTCGENCSPYLALRTLEQWCIDEGSSYPAAVEIFERD